MPRIVRESLLTLEAYAKQRPQLRASAMATKKRRSVHIGPNMMLQFENEETIRYQIQEMLRAEKIFEEEGILDELEAYNPLIPDGTNLKCTQMIEFPDAQERRTRLAELRGVEHRTYVQVAGFGQVFATADEDMERSTGEKTSSVHFLRFEFTPDMIRAIRAGADITMGVDHPAYPFRVEVNPETTQSLARDFS